MFIDFLQFNGNLLLALFVWRYIQVMMEKRDRNSDTSRAIAYLFH